MSDVPTAIRLDVPGNQVEIAWADGHVSRYSGAWLRRICPCAQCRGHAPGEVEPPSWERVRGVRVTHAAHVGSYALQFALSDGHDTGIYSHGWLRANCPGAEGAGARPPAAG